MHGKATRATALMTFLNLTDIYDVASADNRGIMFESSCAFNSRVGVG